MVSMGPSFATIIIPVLEDEVCALKDYLAAHVDPKPGANGSLVCTQAFPFDRVSSLHFMSFLVLPADPEEGIPPQLVLDATFDGDREAFFADLIALIGPGMQQIYAHCVGYPLRGHASSAPLTFQQLEEFRRYLIGNDVGADAYFSGSPGRAVGQVKGEHRLRAVLRGALDRLRADPMPMPATNEKLQACLQEAVRADQNLSWATARAPVPWQVRHRCCTMIGLAVAAIALLGVLGAVVFTFCGTSPHDLYASGGQVLGWADSWGRWLTERGCGWLGGVLTGEHEWLGLARPALSALLLLSTLLLLLYAAELRAGQAVGNPMHRIALLDVAGFLAPPVRYAVMAALGLYTCFMLVALFAPDAASLSGRLAAEIDDYRRLLAVDGSASAIEAVVEVGAVILALFMCAYLRASIGLDLERAPYRRPIRRKLARLAIGLLEIGLLLLLLVLVLRHCPDTMPSIFAEVGCLAGLATVALAWIGGGGAVVLGLLVVLLVVVRSKELLDCYRYHPAAALTERPIDNRKARAREEGGINAYQNHLASVTYVKAGWFRLFALKITLFAVGFLGRYWFNVGALGGIRTILSARWVVIDKGRRLIFLDNYGGGWESYLNEFIDMSAVIGLNAIWTNTFIKWPLPHLPRAKAERYAFPKTRFYTSHGAQDERPFKHYVRYSQVETIAWYGAYHTQSIIDVNANTRIRQALFEPLQSFEVDRLVDKL